MRRRIFYISNAIYRNRVLFKHKIWYHSDNIEFRRMAMSKKLLFLPIFVIALFFLSSVSQADVSIVDIESDIRFSSQAPFDNGAVSTGSGNVGDYVILGCGVVDPNELNEFLPPTPGNWTILDSAPCGGNFSCIGSAWGSFVDTPNSEEINCNWSEDNFVFAGGSMRFSGVDADNPIIGVACATGTGETIATAPSIQTEAGSFVVRIYTFNPLTIPNLSPSTFASLGPGNDGNIQYDSISLNTFQFIGSDGLADFFADAGPTGTRDLTFTEAPISWRACTIALRMGTPPPAPTVPTMSEWGMITFAAFAGIAGFWFIRRRQLAA